MKISVWVSGTGSILATMIARGVPIELVLADRPCKGLDIAKAAGIPSLLVDRTLDKFGYKKDVGENWDRKGFTEALMALCADYKIELIAMAGFMTILHPVIFTRYKGRILNIHPSLLPQFKGERAVRDALNERVETTGTTIHIATDSLDDERYIVAQEKVPVFAGDNEDSLWERIKVVERNLYSIVLQDIISGALDLDDVISRAP